MTPLVLVVEDDALMQKMALKVLRSRGYVCELARSGREAVEMGHRLMPGLILMDLSLPEMNGWEATRALKADPATAKIPVIAITAHAMVGDRETAIEAGCSECLTKPYEIADLVSLVERYLGPAHAQTA
ncbi:MAG TPA: response regulator [Candidatus Limnocylindrales bacterium]|nr:response regulator [Candidatus Limnocylindrales bacterium]